MVSSIVSSMKAISRGSILLVIATLLSVHPIASATEESEVEVSFKSFNQKWMQYLYDQEEREQRNISCKKVKEQYVAEYKAYSKDYSATIKKTQYQGTPYIGILSYREKKFVSQAATMEGAIRGPFNLMDECNVTEIFAYVNGKWQY